MGPALSPPESFAGLFGTALRLASVDDPEAVSEVVRSRATLATWRSATSVPFEQAERARVEVFSAWLEEAGRTRTARADLEPSPEPDPDGGKGWHDRRERLRIPRVTPLAGDKVRRDGAR